MGDTVPVTTYCINAVRILFHIKTLLMSNPADFKILSLDGGGIKGLYAAQLLAGIEQKTGKLSGDYFDMICGTSTGGLIALGITCRIPCKQIARFYTDHGPLIFPRGNLVERNYRLCRQAFFSTKYNNEKLEKALKEFFGGDRTMESANHLMCIPAFNITQGRPTVFKKPFGPYHRDGRFSMVKVALATSAAPTYLPSVSIEENHYIDGGLYGTNPSMIGYTEAMDHFIGKEYTVDGHLIIYDRISMLSLGLPGAPTGERPFVSSRRSFLKSGKKIVESAMSGSAYSTEYQSRKLIEIGSGIYYRLVPSPLSLSQLKIVDMDNTSKKSIQTLISYGRDAGDYYTSTRWNEIEHFFTHDKTYKF